ncbi:MAG: LuxR C-terminal-related transcriptional regulator [Syntrophomonadaceae bacterium]
MKLLRHADEEDNIRSLANESFSGRQPPLIGRDTEVAALKERLLQKEVRLLTLTGAAGVGKTRLALTLLNDLQSLFAHIVYVDLAPLNSPFQVLPAIARAWGVIEGIPDLLPQRLAQSIGSCQLLLALDNCEHILKAKSELGVLLKHCPNLKILATSREIFRLKWELVFPVAPLSVPDLEALPDLNTLSQNPSIDLFVQQVKIHKRNFKLTEKNMNMVAELCVQLDGLPLAIILATSQIRILRSAGLLESLNSRLGLMDSSRRDIHFRHPTLGAAIDWSYDLLTDQEKLLFGRLSVFPGPWTLQEAVGICSGDGLEDKDVFPLLERLVDRSLVNMNKHAGQGKKYRFLETIREYARTRLQESGKGEVLRRRHRDWFLVWAEQGELNVWGPEAPEWLEQIETNLNNFWAAMEWCRDTPQEAQTGLRLWAAIVSFYDLKGHVADGLAMASKLLTLAPGQTVERARTLVQASVLARSQGELEASRRLAEECLSFSADMGDIMDTVAALCTLGSVEQIQGNLEKTESYFGQACSLARMQYEHEPRTLYVALFWLGVFYCFQDQNEKATSVFKEALNEARLQGDVLFEARILAVLGRSLVGKGDLAQAESILSEGVLAAKKLKYYEIIALCFDYLGQAAREQRQKERAVQLFAASAALRNHVGVVTWLPDPNYSLVAVELGKEVEQAARSLCDNLMPEQITAWALSPVETLIPTPGATKPAPVLPGLLTRRELEITQLVTRGLSNRQIAEQLYISRRTVDAHVRHILSKLNLSTRAQVSAWYTEHHNTLQK